MKPKRITSPKGCKLPTGAATRQAILAALPGTARKITDITGRNFSTITAAINIMAKEGIIIEDETRVPVEGGGTPQKVWRLPYVRQVTNDDPWFNAWYERGVSRGLER
jgi:hypothetical protein